MAKDCLNGSCSSLGLLREGVLRPAALSLSLSLSLSLLSGAATANEGPTRLRALSSCYSGLLNRQFRWSYLTGGLQRGTASNLLDTLLWPRH